MIERAVTAGVSTLVEASVRPSDTLAAIGEPIVDSGPGVERLHTIGLHPFHADEATCELPILEDALRGEHRFCAVGELGWDRRLSIDFDVQDRVARRQLELAQRAQLPVVLHVVRAHGRALQALRELAPQYGGMVHGFTGSTEVMRDYLSLGLHISIGAAILNPRAKRAREMAKAIEGSRILIETDAPDVGKRGIVNEPAALVEVLNALAELRNESPDSLAEQCAANAETLFRNRNTA